MKILQGGHTFKNDDAERETMELNIQNNPFKQNDLKLRAAQGRPVTPPPPRAGQERESEFRREEMVLRSVTIANPPEQELCLVFDSGELRDKLFVVLQRYAAQFPRPAGSRPL
jgi:hypothetical protein